MNKCYVIIYTEEFGIINSIERTLNSYAVPNKKINNTIDQIKYQAKEYKITNYITRFQREVLHKKGIEITNESIIKHQYLEIEIVDQEFEGKNVFLGLPYLIQDAAIKSIRKPIYHALLIGEDEMKDLQTNYKNQFINRYEMATFINSNPKKISEKEIERNEPTLDNLNLDLCYLSKSKTEDPKLAWYSIGDKIGEDGWGMTANSFTPINFIKYQNEIFDLTKSKKIQDRMFIKVNANSKILRLKYDRNFYNCSYFIDSEDEFIYNEIKMIY
jgi:hypothetical protein